MSNAKDTVAIAIGEATARAAKQRQLVVDAHVAGWESLPDDASSAQRARAAIQLVRSVQQADGNMIEAIALGMDAGIEKITGKGVMEWGNSIGIQALGLDDEGDLIAMTEDGPVPLDEAMERTTEAVLGGVEESVTGEPVIDGIDLDAEADEPEVAPTAKCKDCDQERTLDENQRCPSCGKIEAGLRDFDGKTG